MIVYDELIQGTPEWFAVRVGKVTASHAQTIATNGKGLDTYINAVMAEKFSSGEKKHYSNENMDRGNELEPLARQMYSLQKGVEVSEIGFCEYNKFVGGSPDGLVGIDGGIEIKSPSDDVYFNKLINENIDSAYEWQCQMNMLILERKWWDLIYYNPNFKKSMKIFRLLPDAVKYKKLKVGFKSAELKIIKINNKYKKL